jgi:hypothetical protein
MTVKVASATVTELEGCLAESGRQGALKGDYLQVANV